MKTYWSAFFSYLFLLALAGCGAEQFGTSPQSTSSQANGLQSFEQLSCSSFTLIKPKVDILYVVDNSTSTYYLASDIQNAIKNTVDSISQEFDYRVVGTGLLPIPNDSTPNDNYQFMTNSTDAYDSEAAGRKVISSSEFNFFSSVSGGNAEAGLRRVAEFMNAHRGSSDSLFRQGAYHLVVLISNGRDVEVETPSSFGNGETVLNQSVYNSRLSSLSAIKTALASQQFRMISVTAKSSCQSGWLPSNKSYVSMSADLYNLSGAQDSSSSLDSYDLCGAGLSSIFAAVNNSIKQVIIPHKYKYWPITSTNGDINVSSIKVYKSSSTSAPVQIVGGWSYKLNPNYPSGYNTRIEPTAGEPTFARHLIEFDAGSEIVYPDCISVTTNSKTEYFGYVVLPKEPKPGTIVLRINGSQISESSTNGWSYIGNVLGQNIKVAHPNPGDELPAVTKSGYMIRLNGSSSYYKSGDSVEAYYIPAGI